MTKTTCHSECLKGYCLYVDDPILPGKAAGEYVGCSLRTLRDLHVPRVPLPGASGGRYGYRRSVLNRMLHELEVASSRLPAPDVAFVVR